MSNQLGKRYTCAVCSSMVLCTKSGDGGIQCCDADMELQLPKEATLFRLIRRPKAPHRSILRTPTTFPWTSTFSAGE